MDLDYPKIGVCSWKQWSQEAAIFMCSKRVTFTERLFATRMVRLRPFRTNPWRMCFARYNMLPFEAAHTIMNFDPSPTLYREDIRLQRLLDQSIYNIKK